MKGQRGARLASEFQKEITQIISRDLRNKCPSLSAIISVTGADIAPDLKTAKIYVSIFDTDEQKRQSSFETIKENAGFIRHELSGRMDIRTVPVLTFILDVSAEYGTHIEEILKKL
ncbi:MAG: 30S ribosome-binding factor RbfA [Clostridia bacterium]|nr:30S ribosome-binding factor RbfA [Clostridia bacterium]MCD8308547.1 30S ribosome-binding factor RbfA [Clostridia bacterium]